MARCLFCVEEMKVVLTWRSPSFDVVAEGDDGSEAMDLVETHKPDVVIMDINMPNMNGVEATKMLVNRYPETKVIILSIHDDENYVQHAMNGILLVMRIHFVHFIRYINFNSI